jgi:hypothetical protein
MLDEKSVFILKRKILPYKDELEFWQNFVKEGYYTFWHW